MREQLRSIAFPAISTGIFGYPPDAGTALAVATIREGLVPGCSLQQVIFACFSPAILAVYLKEISHGSENVPHLA
jgi:O-acetyl-ADP-ribose deacetylase (regulator of RNase III)